MRTLGLAGALALASVATAAASPDDLVARPLVLAPGQVAAQVVLETSLAARERFSPLTLAPDAWVGLTPRLTVGLVHSDASLDRVTFGASLCVRTSDTACPRVYHGSGLDARYLAWTDGAFAVAPRARLILRDIDPAKPATTVGALAAWHRGRWGLTADPYLQLGLANTDRGNRAELVVPIYVALQPACRWALTLQTGYAADVAVWKDGFHIPVAIAATWRATPHLDVGAQLGLTSALGPQNNVKDSEAWLVVGWRTGARSPSVRASSP